MKREYLADPSLMPSDNAQAHDGELNQTNEALKHLPHADVTIGLLLDGVVDTAMTRLSGRLSGQKHRGFGEARGTSAPQAIF